MTKRGNNPSSLDRAHVSDPGLSGRISLKKEELHEEIHERREELHERLDVPVSTKPRWARLAKVDLVRFGGLIAFFALMAVTCVAIAPWIMELTEPGGLDRVVSDVRNAGPVGVLILLGFQFLQIVVAVIPGEVVQIAAGMMYGPWGGAAIVVAGCVVSSAFIYVVVSRLGAPFVRAMIPEKWLGKLDDFGDSEKLHVVVFVLFLIPGLPKDAFTYLVPLTSMRMRDFLFLSNIGRLPGILISTYGANGLMEGDYLQSAILFLVVAAIAVAAIVLHDRILKGLAKLRGGAAKGDTRG